MFYFPPDKPLKRESYGKSMDAFKLIPLAEEW